MGKYLNTLLLTVFLYYKLSTSMNTTYIHSIAFMFIITHSDFWFIQMLNSHSTNTQANFPLTHIHKIPTHSSTVNAYKNPTRTIRKKSHNSPFETITQHQCAAKTTPRATFFLTRHYGFVHHHRYSTFGTPSSQIFSPHAVQVPLGARTERGKDRSLWVLLWREEMRLVWSVTTQEKALVTLTRTLEI